MNREDILKDIASFADDENQIIKEHNCIMFSRFGKDITINIHEDYDGKLWVECNNSRLPYKIFLANELAHLDVLATRLQNKKNDNIYIDTSVTLYSVSNKIVTNKSGLQTLNEECTPSWGGTKICFVTADAGHGKTALLERYEQEVAKNYLENKSPYLFLHINLHGRDLVRLNEAIMYELGELRISGIYYSSIITLMKHNLLILGIDGFDELAAEVGGETALSSLTSLIARLQGSGVLIAASRRTFFNTQDYLKRTKILNQHIDLDCEFDEIKINDWVKEQNIDYLGYYYAIEQAKKIYNNLFDCLHTSTHPLLSRPYLFTKMVNMAFNDNTTPDTFISASDPLMNGIDDVIYAFVKREVGKWKDRDADTGKPYLSFDQHVGLLSEVAKEMWESQRDYISISEIQFILTYLFEEWHIEERLRPMVIRMAESHALLTPVPDKDDYRKFDHDEFKNFFLANSFGEIIRKDVLKDKFKPLKHTLSIAQLPNNVAEYLYKHIPDCDIETLIKGFNNIIVQEWKPTFLSANLGTIIPCILNNYKSANTLRIGPKYTISSITIENKKLSNIVFDNCSFVNISFKNTSLKNVRFENCSFSDIKFISSTNEFENVLICGSCNINMASVIDNEDILDIAYSPDEIKRICADQNIIFEQSINNASVQMVQGNEELKKYIKRFLNKFMKTTYQYETAIREESSSNFGKPSLIFDTIIPLLMQHDIIEEKRNKRTAQASSKAWVLKEKELSTIFMAEHNTKSKYYDFWKDVALYKE